jgi:hypothetical protein
MKVFHNDKKRTLQRSHVRIVEFATIDLKHRVQIITNIIMLVNYT